MATKKDLVESHAFTRRRLVTAFLSGAPGGREVEPSRPGRTVVGGVALAVLLVAGAVIGSVLSPQTPSDWKKPGLVISKETGERYVVLDDDSGDDPQLRPVINVTSAQLILGVDVSPTIVQEDALDGEAPGEDIGILGAPQQLPSSEDFINTGWTACSSGDNSGMQVHLGTKPGVTDTPTGAFLVKSEGKVWMIAEAPTSTASGRPAAYRYLVPDAPNRDNMLIHLGVGRAADARQVPQDWLTLFPAGGDLGTETLSVPGQGAPVTGAGSVQGARVGDLVISGPDAYVYTDSDGQAAHLSDFERTVYEDSFDGDTHESAAAPEDLVGSPAEDANWPEDIPAELVAGENCAQLHAEAGERPYVTLATDPPENASAADLGANERRSTIDPGHGALVNTGDWTQDTSSTTFVIDNNAKAYSLQGQETLSHLEYDQEKTPLVPDSWVEVLGQGVPLSSQLAMCPPQEPNSPPATECP